MEPYYFLNLLYQFFIVSAIIYKIHFFVVKPKILSIFFLKIFHHVPIMKDKKVLSYCISLSLWESNYMKQKKGVKIRWQFKV